LATHVSLRGALPRHQLGRHRAGLQHADPVHVLQIVDRIRDVVRRVHHRRLDGLLPVRDPPGERRPGLHHVVELGGVRAELQRPAVRIVRDGGRPARRGVHESRVRRRVRPPGPRVLQDRRAGGSRQVQPDRGLPPDLRAGDDPVRLGVALEAVPQLQPLPGQLVEHPLAEVAERRVPEVVRQRRRLHHVRVAAAQLLQLVGGLPGHQPFGDRPGHLCHLQAVGEPVVHQQAGATGADHLGDAAQPGEERRADDPVAVHPEGAEREVARRDETVPEQAPGARIVHGREVTRTGARPAPPPSR
jgi:hypothetical protein